MPVCRFGHHHHHLSLMHKATMDAAPAALLGGQATVYEGSSSSRSKLMARVADVVARTEKGLIGIIGR